VLDHRPIRAAMYGCGGVLQPYCRVGMQCGTLPGLTCTCGVSHSFAALCPGSSCYVAASSGYVMSVILTEMANNIISYTVICSCDSSVLGTRKDKFRSYGGG